MLNTSTSPLTAPTLWEDLLTLAKYRIAIASGLVSCCGYLIHSGELSLKLIPLFFGIFFLGSAAAILNQIQESPFDSLMNRTLNRPLPAKRLSLKSAWVWFFLNLAAGLGVLFSFFIDLVPALGLFTLVWYNCVYTPLKRISSLAVFPGGVIGSLTPVIGWVAAGGSFLHPSIWGMAFFLFIWQIPHFLLLLSKYKAEYKKAGFPVLTSTVTPDQFNRMTFQWIYTCGFAAFALPLFGHFQHQGVLSLFILSLILLALYGKKVLDGKDHSMVLAFRAVNGFAIAVLALATIEKLFIL